jgi:hypothetical protein
MFGRVSTLQSPTDRIEDGIAAVNDRVVPALEGARGYKGILTLVDRSSGKMLAITLWEDESAMVDSEALGTAVRNETSDSTGGEVVGVERYEVVADSRK